MEKNLFRKSSLERISSPDQLNEYLRVLNPGVMIILAGFFAIVLAVGVWAFAGTIPDTAEVKGIAFSDNSGGLSVYCYLPISTAKRLSENMSVQISPDYAPREEYGYILAKIQSIGSEPVSEQALVKQYENLQYLQGIIPQGIFVEVVVSLEKDGGNLKWSNKKGTVVQLEKGAYCTGLIVIKERKPYELVFSG